MFMPIDYPGATRFSDLNPSNWAYADITDASNDHTAITDDNGHQVWQTVNGQPAQ